VPVGAGAATASAGNPTVADPADSGAAAFAVQVMAANTRAGAILKLQQHGLLLPAATYAPVEIQGTTWYKVVAGAFPTRSGADSLLAALRDQKLLDSTEGVVVHVPFSLRIDSVRNSTTVDDMLAQLRVGRNLPVYALVQRNGAVWVMVGAFETRSEADAYAETLRSINLVPQVVYRKGRMY
jgi:septal ring-binding cell division protein DamX